MSGFKEQQQQNPVFKDCKVIFFWHHFLENSNSLRSTCSPHQLCYQRASQHPCSTAIFVILLQFMLYSVFSSKHCVKYFQERCKDSLGSYVVGIFFFFFWNMKSYYFEGFFSVSVSFLKMGNSIPEKGTKTCHQRHCGTALWYSNYKWYIYAIIQKIPHLCK